MNITGLLELLTILAFIVWLVLSIARGEVKGSMFYWYLFISLVIFLQFGVPFL